MAVPIPYSKFPKQQNKFVKKSYKPYKKKRFFIHKPKKKLSFSRFITFIKSKKSKIAIIRFRTLIFKYRYCNLYSSINQYSQTNINLQNTYGFFQQKKSYISGRYNVSESFKNKRIYATKQTNKIKRPKNINKKATKNATARKK